MGGEKVSFWNGLTKNRHSLTSAEEMHLHSFNELTEAFK